MKIKLELTVDYEDGDTSYGTLAENLSYMVAHAHAEGCLTDGTDAAVNGYVYTIERIKE